MPPMTATASGRKSSEPVPQPDAIGSNPKIVTEAVIKIGLTRFIAAFLIAS